MALVIVIIYCICMLLVFLFSLVQLHLTVIYLRTRKVTAETYTEPKEWPTVTLQLPLYNEKYVVERLLEAVEAIDYPAGKLEVQILDDSTDETTRILEQKIKALKHHRYTLLRRERRTGYKAGALQYGLEVASGELICIFDADFLPTSDFLIKTVPVFDQPETGMVQARWGHINQDYSLLTQLQAFGLNAHFSIEQTGRNKAGSFINFNGTAGVWRRSCIDDAGGWTADTLSEDLDLSYRAQLKGWKFKYMEEILAPAELPVLVSAVKSQQYRWNKGAAENVRKNLGNILRSKLPFTNKLHSVFHLFNSSVFLFIFIAAIASIPMLLVKETQPHLAIVFDVASIFLIGFLAISYFYWISTKSFYPGKSFGQYVKYYPAFLAFSMGMSFHNTIAVVEGLAGKRTPFKRTPKFNIKNSLDKLGTNIYIKYKFDWRLLVEFFLMLYFASGIALGIYLQDYGLLFFHLLLTTGFGGILFFTFKNWLDDKKGRLQ
jgi:cellulose synthase/poly-beta-1,6-N-acetylglucosamine synthase-like glycosyltransferase